MAALFDEVVVGLRSVFRIVPLGSMKLKTVELTSKPSNAPESDILPTIASTSPWETTVGAGAGEHPGSEKIRSDLAVGRKVLRDHVIEIPVRHGRT